MRRTTHISAALLILGIVLPGIAIAGTTPCSMPTYFQADPTITVLFDKASALPGDIVTVSFEASDVTDLYGLSFRLLYDPLQFAFIADSATDATFFSDSDSPIVFEHDNGSGTLSLAFTRTNGSTGVTGTGVIGSVRFTVLAGLTASVSCPIDSSERQVVDSAGAGITVLTVPGTLVREGVWPGDTDNNCTVGTADVLPIGARFEETGPARTSSTDFSWASKQFTLWTSATDSYVDATGDGEIDQRDVLPIGLNFGQTRAGSTGCTASKGDGGIQFQMPALAIGTEATVDLIGQGMQDILGVSLKASVNSEVLSIVSIEAGSLVDDGDLIEMVEIDSHAAEAGLSRRGASRATSGSGVLARVTVKAIREIASTVTVSGAQASSLQGTVTSGFSLSAAGGADDMPDAFVLDQNYPNPFNPTTLISYSLPESAVVQIAVYDILGREVILLVDGAVSAGTHQVAFDAGQLPGGLYVYQLRSGSFRQTRTMAIVK